MNESRDTKELSSLVEKGDALMSASLNAFVSSQKEAIQAAELASKQAKEKVDAFLEEANQEATSQASKTVKSRYEAFEEQWA